MLSVVVAHSLDPDGAEAIAEILDQCQEQLQGKTPQAGLLFAAIDLDHQLLLDGLMDVFPELVLIGGTTDGELSSRLGFQQDSVSLMLFCSDCLCFRAGVGRQLSQGVAQATEAAVTAAREGLVGPAKLCLTVPDGLQASASAILRSLGAALGDRLPLVGGVAAEHSQAKQTYQFYQREVLSDGLPILLVSGPLLLSHGFASGWKPIGRSGIVTEVSDNIVQRIDDQPALAFYQHYFDDFAPDAAYPLAVQAPGETEFFLRGATGYCAESGSLILGGDVPLGSRVQITEAAQADVICAAKTSLQQAWQGYPGAQPAAALFFSCAWRRWVLGQQTGQEAGAIAEFLQPAGAAAEGAAASTLPYLGFYTFGEIVPLREGGPAALHNTTFVSLLLGTE